MKYKIKLTKKQKQFLLAIAPLMSIALIVDLAGMLIIDLIFPVTVQPFNFSWNGILMFMGIAAGVGWIIHGTGFLLVKVN